MSGSTIHQVTGTWQKNWPTLFDRLCCLTAFAHRPLVNPDVTAVMQPLWRIPFALHDDVTKDLQSQFRCPSTQPVETSQPLSHMLACSDIHACLFPPSCFQKVMSTILAGIPGVAVFLDDIMVHVPDLHIHDHRLHRVFSALMWNNLTLNGGKCTFCSFSRRVCEFPPVVQRHCPTHVEH